MILADSATTSLDLTSLAGAIQAGGLVGLMALAVLAFFRGWVITKKAHEEALAQQKDRYEAALAQQKAQYEAASVAVDQAHRELVQQMEDATKAQVAAVNQIVTLQQQHIEKVEANRDKLQGITEQMVPALTRSTDTAARYVSELARLSGGSGV